MCFLQSYERDSSVKTSCIFIKYIANCFTFYNRMSKNSHLKAKRLLTLLTFPGVYAKIRCEFYFYTHAYIVRLE